MSRGTTIAVLDYGMGNRRSVEKALQHVGARAIVTGDPDRLDGVEALVVPGVGAFPRGMANLRQRGLDAILRDRAAAGTPILGICLGMQLLFDRSCEIAPETGLGLIAGEVTPLETGGLRVPHIGWNEVRFERASALTEGLPASGCPFYHVHSYAARPDRAADVVASTVYGERFATVVAHGSVYGVQFHPEKSSAHGLRLLERFVALASRRASAAAA